MKLVESSAKEFYDKYKNEIDNIEYFEHLMDLYTRDEDKFYTCEKTTANSYYYFVSNYKEDYEGAKDGLIISGAHNFWNNEDINELMFALNEFSIHKRIYIIANCYRSYMESDYGFECFETNIHEEKLVVADVEDFAGDIVPEILEGYCDGNYYSDANFEIEGTQREIIRDKYLTYVYYKDI